VGTTFAGSSAETRRDHNQNHECIQVRNSGAAEEALRAVAITSFIGSAAGPTIECGAMRLVVTHGIVAHLLLVPMAGCASIEVSHRRAARVDFSAYRTFNWSSDTGAPTGDPRLDNPAWTAAVVETANRTLTARGLNLDMVNVPQIWFSYRLVLERKTRIDRSILGSENTKSSSGKEFYTGRPLGDPSQRVEDYDVGTLVIEAVDAASMQLVWRGVAKGVVDPKAGMARRVDRLRSATRKVIDAFPRS